MRLSLLVAAGLMALLTACSKPEYFELIPGSASLERRGQSITLRAVARDRRGIDHADFKPVKWVSGDPKVVEVEDGKIIAVGPGQTTVTAENASIKGALVVDVNTVETFTVNPMEIELEQDGKAFKPDIKVLDFLGMPMRGRVISGRCSNEKICTVDTEPKIWPQNPGETTVDFRCDDRKVTVKLVVTKAKAPARHR